MEGNRLSKPLFGKRTDLLYIDLKVFVTSESKLIRVLDTTKRSMDDVGMQWNEKKCAVTHVRRR